MPADAGFRTARKRRAIPPASPPPSRSSFRELKKETKMTQSEINKPKKGWHGGDIWAKPARAAVKQLGSGCGTRADGCSPRSIAVCLEVTPTVPVPEKSPRLSHSAKDRNGRF